MRLFAVVFTTVFLGNCAMSAEPTTAHAAQVNDWKIVSVPEAFKNPPEGIGWYRGLVKLPADWSQHNLKVFVEPFDAAIEVFWNGTRIGGTGAFPPFFRSGLGGSDRFAVPPEAVRASEVNLVAIRTCFRDGRTGFHVAAPVVFGDGQAIRFNGLWQYRSGDPPQGISWSSLDTPLSPIEQDVFEKIEPADVVEESLRRIDDAGPLIASLSLQQFKVADDLRIDLVVGEPEISQPLSIKWDARGRLWVSQFIQYPEPAGLRMLSRDKFLRSVYDKVPQPPPHHDRGLDRISFHEDTDGDGTLDRHGIFVDGLSLVSSFAFDSEGLWVLVPPYLLFYADKDKDDHPDGDPVIHLKGFGIEDSHSIASNLRWGPDGWLYGSQGSTVTSHVTLPDSKAAPVASLGQCIWRYDPATTRYEIFAEGGGNAFGVEFDSKGRLFSGHNGGDTRGFHYVQGGYYRKGFEKHGELSNPHAYGFFEPIKHHSAPRFTHALLIDEGGALGVRYKGSMFGVAPLQGQIVRSEIFPNGSSIATRDIDVPVSSTDSWFRPVDLQQGPDGAIYICDFYEQRIDHASHYQGRIDRERGRVWRLSAKGAPSAGPVDLTAATTDTLIELLSSANRWIRQTALLQLVWKHPAGAREKIALKLFHSDLPLQDPLGSLENECGTIDLAWAFMRLATPSEKEWLSLLSHRNNTVRAWAIRMLCDSGTVSPLIQTALIERGREESNSSVRSQLASSLRRLSEEVALPIVIEMLGTTDALPANGDITDVHVPLLLWWAIESIASSHRDELLAELLRGPLWNSAIGRVEIAPRLMRRLASGTRSDLMATATLLDSAPDSIQRDRLLEAFEKAFEGRSLSSLPNEVIAGISRAGGGSPTLRLRRGEPAALADCLRGITDDASDRMQRLTAIDILGQTRPEGAREALLMLVRNSTDEAARRAALGSLEAWNDSRIATEILEILPTLPLAVRSAALDLLASRPAWTERFLETLAAGSFSAQEVPEAVVRRMLLHSTPMINQTVEKMFGSIQGASTAAMQSQIDLLVKSLGQGSGIPTAGRTIFLSACASCHVLFKEGGHIGPDLTSHDRSDPRAMLVHVVNPSAVIREGFESSIIITDDGRALSGFIVEQDASVVVLRTVDGRTASIPRDTIEQMHKSPKSLMPEGLLDKFDEQQVRDLLAYLRSTQPLAAR